MPGGVAAVLMIAAFGSRSGVHAEPEPSNQSAPATADAPQAWNTQPSAPPAPTLLESTAAPPRRR